MRSIRSSGWESPSRERTQPLARVREPAERKQMNPNVAQLAAGGDDCANDWLRIAFRRELREQRRTRAERADRRSHTAAHRVFEKRREPSRPREARDEARVNALCTQHARPGQEWGGVEKKLGQEGELQSIRGGERQLVAFGAAKVRVGEPWMSLGMTRDKDAADG